MAQLYVAYDDAFHPVGGNTGPVQFTLGSDSLSDVTLVTIAFTSGMDTVIPANFLVTALPQSLVIQEGYTEVGAFAFQSWFAATSLSLPSTMTTIGESSFAEWNAGTSLVIPNSVTTLGVSSFYNWLMATSLTLSTSLTDIPETCFVGWLALTELTVPEGVETIGFGAFDSMEGCLTLDLPSTLLSIGDYGFSAMTALETLTCLATTPPTIESSTFLYLPPTAEIHVPTASVAAYEAAPYWSDFVGQYVGI